MKTILVIDTKLVFYYQYQRHKHPFNSIQDIANKVSLNFPQKIDKVVWAVDAGKSKRIKTFPAYKAHRKDMLAKQTPAQKKLQKEFEKTYNTSWDFLRYFGSVISIDGYEADDLASIIAKNYADSDSVNIILLSSDEDWARFLYADNITLLHYGRGTPIYRGNVEEVYGVPVEHKLFVDSLSGVRKENVDGLVNLGKTRITKLLREYNYSHDKVLETLATWCHTHKYGATLPKWAESVEDVLTRNLAILSPYDEEEFTTTEKDTFFSQWGSRKSATQQDILLESLQDFGIALQITPQISRVFKIS